MNISTNVSSISAHQGMLNNSAHNVANASSDKSQTDLAKEIPDQMLIQKTVAANANVIKAQDEMLGSLLDIKA